MYLIFSCYPLDDLVCFVLAREGERGMRRDETSNGRANEGSFSSPSTDRPLLYLKTRLQKFFSKTLPFRVKTAKPLFPSQPDEPPLSPSSPPSSLAKHPPVALPASPLEPQPPPATSMAPSPSPYAFSNTPQSTQSSSNYNNSNMPSGRHAPAGPPSSSSQHQPLAPGAFGQRDPRGSFTSVDSNGSGASVSRLLQGPRIKFENEGKEEECGREGGEVREQRNSFVFLPSFLFFLSLLGERDFLIFQ